jgi:hypothetical protein
MYRFSIAVIGGEFGRVDHMIPWQIDHQQIITQHVDIPEHVDPLKAGMFWNVKVA